MGGMPEGCSWAEEVARQRLESLGNRWLHVLGVGRRAEEISDAFALGDALALKAAAYLHDIGYAPDLRRTGAHQLDGAYFAHDLGIDDRIVNLIAHHSESRYELSLRGLQAALSEFRRESSLVYDALVYCDLTTSPQGALVSVRARLDEVRERYEPGGLILEALHLATPELMAAVRRTEELLRRRGLAALLA